MMNERQRELLKRDAAYLPGSRDLANRPILIVNPQAMQDAAQSKAVRYEDLAALIAYLSQCSDEASRIRGLLVLIDARSLAVKQLRSALRACQHAAHRLIRNALIVKSDRFLDEQKINLELIVEAYEFKASNLDDQTSNPQLPAQFGGTFPYDSQHWIQWRSEYERFVFDSENKLKSPHIYKTDDHEQLLKQGEHLRNDLLQSSSNPDTVGATRRIEQILIKIKNLESSRSPDAFDVQGHRSMADNLIEQHLTGVRQLNDWLHGAGEKWLLSLREIGESVDEASQLAAEHGQLQEKTRQVEAQVDQMREMAQRLASESPGDVERVQNSTEILKSSVMAFSERVHRQSDILDESLHFHELVAEFSRKTDDLVRFLCSDASNVNRDSVEMEQQRLDEQMADMDSRVKRIIGQGRTFISKLEVVEYNALGKEVVRDHFTGIVHVRQQLNMVEERRRRCRQLVDVRRLKLQQMIQLFTCEADAEQAVKWIVELCETLQGYAVQIGDNEQLAIYRKDLAKLEDTARTTHEYGKQLCQSALVLRRSLRCGLQPYLDLNHRIEEVWGDFCRMLNQLQSTVAMCEAFYRAAREIESHLDHLSARMHAHLNLVSSKPLSHRSSMSSFNEERRQIGSDIRELKHIAELLDRSEMKDTNNRAMQCAFSRIAAKMTKVDSLWSMPRQDEDNASSIGRVSSGGERDEEKVEKILEPLREAPC